MSPRASRALVGLVAAGAVLALPAVASATINPVGLSLTEPTGTTAGASPATVNLDTTFSPMNGDSPKDITFALPSGLLVNADQAGGTCLLSSTPNASCQVGGGTMTAVGTSMPVSLYLVKAPSPGDIAGVALVQAGATLTTADVTLRSTPPIGLDIAFSSLPNDAISELDLSFTSLRLPTSCPSPAANVIVTADSYQSATTQSDSKPLNVTGCTGLPYAPVLTASLIKDAKDQGGELDLGISQAATESASKSITLGLGNAISPNLTVVVPCLTGSGSGCTIGTAAAASPLFPSAALAAGSAMLSGTATAPTITITFPAPFALTLSGAVSLTSGSVTFANVPDVPLTSLTLTLSGPNGQKAFNVVSCAPRNLSGSFTDQGGITATSSAAIKFVNCARKPTASGLLSGLAAGHPKLRLKATHGNSAPNIASVAIGLPSGLQFARSAFVTRKTCVTKNGKKKCTTTTLVKGLGVSGAKVKSVALKGGKLLVTLKKAAGSVTVNLTGPFVAESKSLQTRVKKHKVKTLTVTLKVTDAKHTATSVPVKLKPH